MSPEEVEELDEDAKEVLPPNPYVIKKDNTELDEEFDKPDLLSEEVKTDLSNDLPKKTTSEKGISKVLKIYLIRYK